MASTVSVGPIGTRVLSCVVPLKAYHHCVDRVSVARTMFGTSECSPTNGTLAGSVGATESSGTPNIKTIVSGITVADVRFSVYDISANRIIPQVGQLRSTVHFYTESSEPAENPALKTRVHTRHCIWRWCRACRVIKSSVQFSSSYNLRYACIAETGSDDRPSARPRYYSITHAPQPCHHVIVKAHCGHANSEIRRRGVRFSFG